MAWTLDELLKINEGNTNLYTPYSNPGVYTRNDTPKVNQADMLSQLLANPDRGLLSLDQEIVASNQNDQWNAYGYYSLGPDGRLARTDAGTLKADLGQGGALSGTLNTPYGQVTPYYEGATTAGNGNDRWASYGLYDSNKQKVGNAGTLHYDIGGGGWAGDLGAALSLGTGGLSDVIEGHTPFSRAIENAGENLGLNQHTQDWMKDISGDILSPIGFAGQTAYRAHDKATEEGGSFKGGVWADRFIDPSGTIDYSVREMGNIHREISPELTDNAQQIGTAVGGTIGSMFPVIGTGVGAAVGSGIGSKTAGGTKSYDYTGDLIDAGVSYVAAEGVPNISGPVGGAVTPYIGQAGGKVVGGVAQGGLRGAAGGVKPAVESGSIDPIWKGAATGAVLGGVAAGASEAYRYFNPTMEELAYKRANESPGEHVYLETPQQAMGDEAYQYAQDHPGQWIDAKTGQIHPTYGVGSPTSMYPTTSTGNVPYAPANPSGMFPLDKYGNIQYAPAAPEIAYPLGSNAERLNAINAEPQFASDYIHPYTLGSGYGADVEVGSTNYDPNNTYFNEDPSLWSTVNDYAKRFGNALLDNIGPIRDLAGKLLNPGGDASEFNSGIGDDEGNGKGRQAMEQDWLAALPSGGVGKGKSKGLGAGYVDKLKYDPSLFMPNKRVKKYTDTGLYE